MKRYTDRSAALRRIAAKWWHDAVLPWLALLGKLCEEVLERLDLWNQA